MLLSIFTPLYELIIGSNADYPEYAEGIFDSVGLITFIIAVVICMIFYLALGRWKGVWYNVIHWVITIIVCAAIGFGLAFSITKGNLDLVDGYVISFAFINALYAAIYFIVFSFFFKNFSIFSKRTPI